MAAASNSVSGESITYGVISIRGGRENNLKDVDLDVPKGELTVFTGVSGSGKSSIAFDTIAAESQRLLNETQTAFIQNFLPPSHQPEADSLTGITASIVVDQQAMGGGPRSTVGTATDAFTLLRRLWGRLGSPNLGSPIAFSFNTPIGMCPACEGVGKVSAIDVDALLDRTKSLNDGAIDFPNFQVGSWYWKIFAECGRFDPDAPLETFTEQQWDELLNLPETKTKVEISGMNLTYEGLLPKLTRLYLRKDPEQLQTHMRTAVLRIATRAVCAECEGARLNAAARGSLVGGISIGQAAEMQVDDLVAFFRALEAPGYEALIEAILERLEALVRIGLGYISLARETSSLSGGESQRVKMVRHLGSALTDVTYVFDEPSVGLHPHDVHRMNELLLALRDKGNTVLVVEHKPEVIEIADYIVDVGPGAGSAGGTIVYTGDVDGLRTSGSVTGEHLTHHQELKTVVRKSTGSLRVKNANLHNLKDVSLDVPTGVLVAVTGVAGSGKSSLVRGVLPRQFPHAVVVDQATTRGSRRSNPATYTGMLDHIRKVFAKANGVKPALFSANSEGACPECKGLGVVFVDLGTIEPASTECETCNGRRFTEAVLAYTVRGASIADVLEMPVVTALEHFAPSAGGGAAEKPIAAMLTAMADVGIGYLTLGQPLSTLSGGERQRLKLAIELGSPAELYILDEPTTGLHMSDVDRLISLIDRFVDAGSSVLVIEHNLDVISRADHVIDMGPGAGAQGGTVVFQGTPSELVAAGDSLTGQALAARHGLS